MSQIDRKAVRRRVRSRIRKRLRGSAVCPRVAVHRTLKHIYCQAIDDDAGVTLAHASTTEKSFSGAGGGVEAAKAIGTLLAERVKGMGVEKVVFDRGGFLYHGRVKALAEAAREGGLKF